MDTVNGHIDILFALLEKNYLQHNFGTCRKILQVLGPVYSRLPQRRVLEIGTKILEPKEILRFSQQALFSPATDDALRPSVLVEMANFQIFHGKYKQAYDQIASYLTVLPYQNESVLFGISALLSLYFSYSDPKWAEQSHNHFVKYFELSKGGEGDQDMFLYYFNLLENADRI